MTPGYKLTLRNILSHDIYCNYFELFLPHVKEIKEICAILCVLFFLIGLKCNYNHISLIVFSILPTAW